MPTIPNFPYEATPLGTSHGDLFAALGEPFDPQEVKVRSLSGRQIHYITARTVMNRLDNVLGPEFWTDEYFPHENSVLCRLTITLPDGSTLTKADAGGYAGMSDSGDDDKSGYSDAFKRAAVKFGVARYLYRDGVPNFYDGRPPLPAANGHAAPAPPPRPAECLPKADRLFDWCKRHGHLQRAEALASRNYGCGLTACTDEQADFIYDIIQQATAANDRAAAASPAPPRAAPAPRQPQGAVNENGAPVNFGWPRTGPSLYAWMKNLGAAYQTDLVGLANREFDGRFPRSMTKEWNAEQIEAGALFVARIVKALPGYDGQFDHKLPNLDDLRDMIATTAKTVLTNGGSPDPGYPEICSYLDVVARELGPEFGGQIVDDLETCADEPLLKAVLDGVTRDLTDATDTAPF